MLLLVNITPKKMIFKEKRFFSVFFNLEALSGIEKKRTKLLIIFCLVWSIQTLLSVFVILLMYKNTPLLIGHLLILLGLIFVFYFLRIKQVKTSVIMFLSLAFTINIMFTSVLTPGNYTEYFFLFVPPLILIFTDNKLLTYLFFFLSYIGFILPNKIFNIYQDQYFQDDYFSFILFTVVFFLVYYFKSNNIKNEKLLEIKTKELEELNQFQSQFFINISHEIKTPLTLIKGQVDQLNQTEDTEKVQKQINTQVNNIKRIVDDVIDLSKMCNSSFSLQSEVINLEKLLYKIHLSFESLFAQKNIAFSYVCSNKNCFIKADVLYLERALNNLVLNAYKYTDKGGKVVLTLSKKQDVVSFSISDTGIGIEKNKQEKIFNRFYQVDNDVNKSGGSGVGLAFTKEIIGLLHGEILVDSTPDIGTVISINFPFKNDYKIIKKEENQSQKTILKEKVKSTNLGIKTSVLIVDDSFEMRVYLKDLLDDYNCFEAENGVEALDVLKTKKIDFVLTDYMMPKMNGFDLITHMKNNNILIPTLMLTARSDYNSKLEVLRLGVDDYLSKPFEKEELLVRIQNILANQNSRNNFVAEQGISNSEIKENTDWVLELKQFIVENSEDPKLNQIEIAEHFNISKSTFYRKVKMETGLTPNRFITEVKLLHARNIVEQNTDISLKELSLKVGFLHTSYFATQYKNRFGVHPIKELV